ncbi:MAG: hypothetical protein ACJAYC_002434 [Halieaceae bacterium]|jgi:hypothetical protein
MVEPHHAELDDLAGRPVYRPWLWFGTLAGAIEW